MALIRASASSRLRSREISRRRSPEARISTSSPSFKRLDNGARQANGQAVAPLRDFHGRPPGYTPSAYILSRGVGLFNADPAGCDSARIWFRVNASGATGPLRPPLPAVWGEARQRQPEGRASE